MNENSLRQSPKVWQLYVIIILIAALALSLWMLYQKSNAWDESKMIKEISVIYDLPPDTRAAIIANIDDLRKINKFYDKARNGDILAITGERAILYDPAKKRIIDVLPVQVDPKQSHVLEKSSSSSSAQ